MLLAAASSVTLAGEASAQSAKQERPIPATPAQSLTAIEHAFTLPKPPPLTLFPHLRERMADQPAFLRDSKFDLDFRSYYRNEATAGPGASPLKEAWAAGGSLSFESGRLFDVLSVGAVLYTSLPVYAPAAYGNTGLLLETQQGYAALGQLYARARLFETHYLTVGRYYYDTPFLGPHDNRMSPNTFYGYSLMGTFGNTGDTSGDTSGNRADGGGGPSFHYGIGWIGAIKPQDAIDFQGMARAAGANADYGTAVLGGRLTWGRASIGAIEYYTQDTLNIFYTEAKYGLSPAPDVHLLGAVQFAAQNSVGQSLLNGGVSFATNQLGAKVELGYDTAILTLGYSVVNPGFGIQTPWSANPFYTDAQIQDFQRAGEQALMVGASYVFKHIGLPGVAASVFYFNGWTAALAAGLPLVESEWDFTLEWRPEWKPLDGLWFRARYGTNSVWQGGALATTEELRLIASYKVKLY